MRSRLIAVAGALACVSPFPAKAADRSFSPSDFAAQAPRTGYDMLRLLPGFTIHGASSARGLGQASENVLINGRRIANKSGGAIDELQRVSIVNVVRIEIVEAASLGLAGLGGEVANVILKSKAQGGGQFEYKAQVRAHYADPSLVGGSISYAGQEGPVGYTLSFKNDSGRGAYGGGVRILDRDRNLVERRFEVFRSNYEPLAFGAKFSLDGPGSSTANLSLNYEPYWNPFTLTDRRVSVANGEERRRTIRQTLTGWVGDLNADAEFALGPGRLKLIGVRHHDHEPVVTTQRMTQADGNPDTGIRLVRDSLIDETVVRAEYGWKGKRNAWQLTGERAVNSLDQRGQLFLLSPEDRFEQQPFPGGSGHVREARYEAMVSFSRALGPKLDLQLAGGAEWSTLDRLDGDIAPRRFFRPKGSLTLGWRPAPGWDVSARLNRKVGQISFYDFLSQPELARDRENEGNPDLVPSQSWVAELEAGRDLGKGSKTRLKLYAHAISDIIDFIPLPGEREGVGNLPSARRLGLESVSTIQFDPLGWKGAKLDLTLGLERSRTRDPLTGRLRPISGSQTHWATLSIRHDLPRTSIAWGGDVSYTRSGYDYYLTEVSRTWEGPWFAEAFVEHKNLAGMTVRATLFNLFGGDHYTHRVVHEGFRDRSPIAFIQVHDQRIGPVFILKAKGRF